MTSGVFLSLMLALSAGESAQDGPYTVEELKALFEKNADAVLIPELARKPPADLAKTDMGKEMLEWGRGAANEPIPLTTYTLYRTFRREGTRPPYQEPYFGKRDLLNRHVMAAWLSGDDAHIDAVNDFIWSICEETSWVAPAHERNQQWTIDLFAAETGVDLAYTLTLIGDRLPDEVRERVRSEVYRRILDPYLEHARGYWWNRGRNNWTGVCAGSIGQTCLLLETDPDRQAKTLALVLGQLDRFINLAFEEDGGCLEGIGYWNYGLLHHVTFAEMLRNQTGGAIDLLAHDKFKAIARYPETVALDRHIFASFSDAHEHSTVVPFLGERLAGRTGADALRSQFGSWNGRQIVALVHNLIWCDGRTNEAPAIENAFLPVSGIGKRVGRADGERVVVIAKAGHNAESHNNNDVGSFVVRVGSVTYLCDPGGGLYNKDYFGPKRYENVFANSYGHSVPRIGGRLQPTGGRYRGSMTMDDGVITIQAAEAYDVPELERFTRSLSVKKDGTVVLEDQFAFSGKKLEVEEALMTWQDVEVDGSVARVLSKEGVLEIRGEDVTFAAERLEEACKANHKSGVLTRITIAYPPARERTVRLTMRFVPKP